MPPRAVHFACLCLLVASSVAAQPALELMTDAVTLPMHVTHAGDERLFIVERPGQVRVFSEGSLRATPFLDVSDAVSLEADSGLYSIAFHPRYAENGHVFAFFVEPGGFTLTMVVARFTVEDGDPNTVAPASRRDLLRIATPSDCHVGGQIQFGPDGYLYASTGDGCTDDVNCLAQDPQLLLGKLLRLDVDLEVDAAPWYEVPATNPFVGAADPGDRAADEIWASGLRNPFRFSFDRSAGSLWLGDVGRDSSEEIDFQPATSSGGENYGWNVMEGNVCVLPGFPVGGGCPAATPPCDDPAYTPPLLEIPHSGDGLISVVGGAVYRGTQSPGYQGHYVFADTFQGAVWALDPLGTPPEPEMLLPLGSVGAVAIGEDRDGELLIADLFGNRILRLRLGAAAVVPDDACILRANTAAAKLAQRADAELRRCALEKARGRSGVDVAGCLASDRRGRLARRAEKLEATEVRFCAAPQPFGFTDAMAAAGAAREGAEGLAAALFGEDPDEALANAGSPRDAQRCQRRILRAAGACQKARRSGFLGCARAGLRRGEVASVAALAECLNADPKGRVARVCGGKVMRSIERSCRDVALPEVFPGCTSASAPDLVACLDAATRCRHCRFFDTTAALGVNCDLLDDGASNRSCLPLD